MRAASAQVINYKLLLSQRKLKGAASEERGGNAAPETWGKEVRVHVAMDASS